MAAGHDRTEKPTAKKLRDARRKGNVAKSRDAGAAATCLGGSLALYFSAGLMREHTGRIMEELWGMGFQAGREENLDTSLFLQLGMHFFQMVLPTLGTILILSSAVHFAQVRGLISWESIQPKLSKLNPLEGFKRLFSIRSMVELVKSILKLAFISWVVYFLIYSERHIFLPMVDMETAEIVGVSGGLALKIAVRSSILMLVLAILDYAYQRWQYVKDLMMTKQEVKEEYKETEGNPLIKSRIRSIQRALSRQRMMSRVPRADVVITNPTHYAVALEYKTGMDAPRLVAKGQNLLAKKIIEIARKHSVPVVRNPPLARALYKEMELEETIPVTLYRAVAKVLAYVYQQKGRRG